MNESQGEIRLEAVNGIDGFKLKLYFILME